MTTAFLYLSLLAVSTVNALPTRIARASSGKRGLPFHDAKLLNLFPIDGAKFSWCYNWSPSFNPPPGLVFVPLLHGNQPEHTNGWLKKFEDSGATEVFSFNEPDQCGEGSGGSCITDVKTAADAYREFISTPIRTNGKLKGVRAGAPSVTNGDAPKGKDYLDRFLQQCADCQIDFLNAHWYASATANAYYDPLEKFQTQIKEIHNLNPKLKVWVTEWGFDAGSEQDRKTQMKRIIDWMEEPEQDWIERYAYQWAAPGFLVNDQGTALSALGTTYATS